MRTPGLRRVVHVLFRVDREPVGLVVDHLPAAVLLAAGLPVAAEDHQPLPDKLTFGYEEEGAVDASKAGCEAFVKEMVEWSKEDMQRAIRDVCAARQAHVAAYAAIQKSYRALVTQIREDNRLEQAASVRAIQTMVKS